MSHVSWRPRTGPGSRCRAGRLPLVALTLVTGTTLAAAGLPRGAGAQAVQATLDLGAAGIRYADSVNTMAATVTPAIRVAASHAVLGASASFSELGTGAWTTQGALAASAFATITGPLRAEIAGTAGGSAHEDGTRTGQLDGVARLGLVHDRWGAWAGGGAGAAWNGSVRRSMLLGDAGVWVVMGPVTAYADVTPQAVGDSLRFTDGSLAVRWELGRAEFDAGVGTRIGRGLVGSGEGATWGSMSAQYWLAPRLALVASAGSYPADLTQGFPQGRYLSVGLRIAAPPHAAPQAAAPPASMRNRSVRLTVEGTGETRTVMVEAPGASRVELAGDMTDWAPLVLASDGSGRFVATIAIAPGVHQVAVRLDGGPWIVPSGLLTVTDEFGGTAGVLMVK